jgi:hypothetical protein
MNNFRAILSGNYAGTRSTPFSRRGGLKNGELLRRAADAGFEVFVTADRNLEFQQNLSQTRLGVILLVAPSNALEDLLPLVPGPASRNPQKPVGADSARRGVRSRKSHFDVSRILETWKFRQERGRKTICPHY